MDEPHIGGLFAHKGEKSIKTCGTTEVDEGKHEDKAEQRAENGDGKRCLDDEKQTKQEDKGELHGDMRWLRKLVKVFGYSPEDIVLGTEGARDKGKGAAEDEDGVIEETVVDEVVLVEFDGAVYAEIEESGGKKDEQGVVLCDKGKEEG